jgi:hypothetical protein
MMAFRCTMGLSMAIAFATSTSAVQADSATFIRDPSGAREYFASDMWPRANGSWMLDNLNGEEFALGSPALIQARVVSSARGTNLTVIVERVFFAGHRSGGRWALRFVPRKKAKNQTSQVQCSASCAK